MNNTVIAPQHRALKKYRIPIGVAVGAVVATGLVMGTAPAQAATKVIPGNLVDTSETRANGHNDFSPAGVHVYTDGSTDTGPKPGGGTWNTDKAAGYFDVNRSLNAVAAVEPTMAWTADGPTLPNLRPGMQLKIDFNGDGSIDGILVGELAYGNDWWLPDSGAAFVKAGAPSHTGGSGSDNHGTLAQWKTNFPAAKVFQSGWSLGSGAKGNGNIANFKIAGDTYTFTSPQVVTTKVLTSAEVDQSDTRANGHNVFLLGGGGVNVYTDGSTDTGPAPGGGSWNTDKAAGYFDAQALPLSQAGEPSLAYIPTSGDRPSAQLVVDFDNDAVPDGILVGEPVYNTGLPLYGNDWWLSNGSSPLIKADAPQHGGGFGSDNHGQLSEWRAAFPNAKILAAGWSLGSGAAGNGVITSITVGATQYKFTGTPPNTAPTAAPVTGSGAFQGGPVTVTLLGSDAQGDPLTYTAGPLDHPSDGSLSAVTTNHVTFTPAFGFSGNATFPYTVKDAGHPAVSGTVTITIAGPPVDPLLTVSAVVTPGANASKRTIVLSGTAAAPLPALGGLKIMENGAQRSGGGVSQRKYKVSLGNGNAAGTHIYTVVYAGHSSTIVVHAN
jgi:hypothetical protein